MLLNTRLYTDLLTRKHARRWKRTTVPGIIFYIHSTDNCQALFSPSVSEADHLSAHGINGATLSVFGSWFGIWKPLSLLDTSISFSIPTQNKVLHINRRNENCALTSHLLFKSKSNICLWQVFLTRNQEIQDYMHLIISCICPKFQFYNGKIRLI